MSLRAVLQTSYASAKGGCGADAAVAATVVAGFGMPQRTVRNQTTLLYPPSLRRP